MDFKNFADSLDKLTDILNVGRLVFYTAAGFCATLPFAMTLRLLAQKRPQAYWRQFVSDMSAASNHWAVWGGALVAGFIIAAVSYVLTRLESRPLPPIDTDSYSYRYPRLFSGGVLPDKGKDYAAWLVSEYYRYLEIVWFIPVGALVALPILSSYSFLYLIKTDHAGGFICTAAHVAFALWTLAALLAWDIVWPRFWVPKIIQPLSDTWDRVVPSTVAGLEEFVTKSKEPASQPKPPAQAQ